MLDSKETKLLMKFSIYPKLMLGGFVAMLASAVFSCILLIPNSLLLNISPKQLPDYILTLDSVVMFGGAFIGIFSLIAIKVIQGYPEFKSLQKGAFNEFDSTDYIKAIRAETKLLDSEEAAAVTFGVIFAMAFAAMEAADKMAQEYKVKVPKLKNTIITMIFISLFIILSANTIACFNLCKERRLHFAEAKIELDSIYDTLMQSDVDRVKAEEPSAKLIDFPVRAYWNEDEIDEYQLNVELNAEDLNIDSIS
ncbi:MAG: hypothetical protein IKW81_06940, partial [Pseudobutyrivibrio sp.]|nr:hypothetical protein [Pseudobutyrivibrio sp.]